MALAGIGHNSGARAYYNEIDPYAVRWLRNLIDAGHIAPGEVDDRSIVDVRPGDLADFTQCHFFAGIGVWSYALRRAGWPDSRPVWTASCPCQPFSAAGKGGGFSDERHLWPALFHLIGHGRPEPIFGEQVASPDGLAWLDLVCDDMEGAGYTLGAVDCCAAGVGAPHIRQRLWWMAFPERGRQSAWKSAGRRAGATLPPSTVDGLGVPAIAGSQGITNGGNDLPRPERQALERTGGHAGELGHPEHGGRHAGIARDAGTTEGQGSQRGAIIARPSGARERGGPGPLNGFWRDADWLRCRDERWRPVEPGASPLASGAPARVGRLRAYGNAINAEAATEMIRVFMECLP